MRAKDARRDFHFLSRAFVAVLLDINHIWSADYSACVVYTKTIIPLSVGESSGFLPRRYNRIAFTISLITPPS